jgi:hypothetical protein
VIVPADLLAWIAELWRVAEAMSPSNDGQFLPTPTLMVHCCRIMNSRDAACEPRTVSFHVDLIRPSVVVSVNHVRCASTRCGGVLFVPSTGSSGCLTLTYVKSVPDGTPFGGPLFGDPSLAQAHWNPDARALIARRRANGDGGLEAIRVLKRRLSDFVSEPSSLIFKQPSAPLDRGASDSPHPGERPNSESAARPT